MYELINSSLASGRAVHFLIGVGGPQQLQMQPRSNVLTNQFERIIAGCGLSLSSQSGCLREWIGAQGRVRRGPSLGDSTSAGAENSQATLHALRSDRPTMTAFSCEGWPNTPALASLTSSESSVLVSRSKA